MKSLILVIGLLIGSDVRADDNWFCKQAVSERRGNEIVACGVGRAKDEASAREAAFDHSKAEFDRVCGASTDCKGHEVVVNPKRADCAQYGDQHECYRLVVYAIGAPVAQPAAEQFPAFEDTIPVVAQADEPEDSQEIIQLPYYRASRSQ